MHSRRLETAAATISQPSVLSIFVALYFSPVNGFQFRRTQKIKSHVYFNSVANRSNSVVKFGNKNEIEISSTKNEQLQKSYAIAVSLVPFCSPRLCISYIIALNIVEIHVRNQSLRTRKGRKDLSSKIVNESKDELCNIAKDFYFGIQRSPNFAGHERESISLSR